MSMYPVAEKFVSINGEGPRAGELAVFLRFRGCNLHCAYCDTKWANAADCPVQWLDCAALCAYVASTGVTNVTLTGGEPLLQPLRPLVEGLIGQGNRVEIETNGSLPLDELAGLARRPAFTMDYKLSASGMEHAMHTDNFALLREADTVKFVVGSEEDLLRAQEIALQYALIGRCHVYFSPVFGAIAPERIVAFLREWRLNDVRVQLQLHKYIWNPDARGV